MARRAKPERHMTPKLLAAWLQKAPAGEGITEELIRADVAAGAPANRDGRVDLVRYTAWLLRQHGYGEKP